MTTVCEEPELNIDPSLTMWGPFWPRTMLALQENKHPSIAIWRTRLNSVLYRCFGCWESLFCFFLTEYWLRNVVEIEKHYILLTVGPMWVMWCSQLPRQTWMKFCRHNLDLSSNVSWVFNKKYGTNSFLGVIGSQMTEAHDFFPGQI